MPHSTLAQMNITVVCLQYKFHGCLYELDDCEWNKTSYS